VKLSEAIFAGVDLETTGFDPKVDQVCELALRVGFQDNTPLFAKYETLVLPTIPIPCTASAVHHLTDEDVAEAPSREQIGAWLKTRAEEIPDAVFYAHNAAFELSFLPELAARRWLCTMRAAKHLYPDAPGYGNQVLRYWLGLDKISLEGKLPHRASADIIVTEAILREEIHTYLMEHDDDLGEFLAYVASPIEYLSLPFGKHKDVALALVPRDYLNWCLQKMTDLDPDIRFSIRKSLGQLEEAAA